MIPVELVEHTLGEDKDGKVVWEVVGIVVEPAPGRTRVLWDNGRSYWHDDHWIEAEPDGARFEPVME